MDSQKNKIPPKDLVCMNDYEGTHALRVELVYARDIAPNIFEQIYSADSQLFLHKDLARVVLRASELAEHHRLVLYDGLRPIEAQEKMQQAPIVKANPDWLEEPNRLLSPPGAGAHPRGMAIDLTLETLKGDLLDMGTVFDELRSDDNSHPLAARHNTAYPESVLRNQKLLEDLMLEAAKHENIQILPLPQEWWDFRLPAEIYEVYAPISDADLPSAMQMT